LDKKYKGFSRNGAKFTEDKKKRLGRCGYAASATKKLHFW